MDRFLLADNIRGWRQVQGISQAELARRATVGITTVYKAELGKPVRVSSLRKIVRLGLQGSFEEACLSPRLSNPKPDGAAYVKHDLRNTKWFVYGDRRRLVPPDNLDLIQDVQERIRLGQRGFATLFGCGVDYIMPRGPGVLIYEVHGPTDVVTQNYRDGIYFALRGSVRLRFAEEEVTLAEGESVGLDPTQRVSMDLAAPILPGQLPPLVQFIGANRIGKVPTPRHRSSADSAV